MKKKLSGSENRKRKAEREKLFEQAKKRMNINKYLTEKPQEGIPSASTAVDSADKIFTTDPESEKSEPLHEQFFSVTMSEASESQLQNISDISTWPKVLTRNMTDHIIMSGPSQIHLKEFPKDEEGRHFSENLLKKTFKWRNYSTSVVSLFDNQQ